MSGKKPSSDVLGRVAGVPAPYLYLSFDRDFHIEGTGIGTLKHFTDSPFPGVAKTPAGEFVEGFSGKAFIPQEDLSVEGDAVLPLPEGTVSFWMKPVNYQEDWIGGIDTRNPGRIGYFFTASHSGEKAASYDYRLQPRGYERWDAFGGLNYYENWWSDGPQSWEIEGTLCWLTGSQSLSTPFDLWQDGLWRMVTIVWKSGERRVFFNGLPFLADFTARHIAQAPATRISIPAGSKAVDELTVWDAALTDAQVAATFYSRMPGSRLKGAVQKVPRPPVAPDMGKEMVDDVWENTVKSSSWECTFSGMASDAKDTLELGHRDGCLFIRYREPMPEDYAAVATRLGGSILKGSISQRDGNVWEDDCVEVRLSPDRGKTDYVFAVSAGGAMFDARNGDKAFDADGWVVRQDAGERFWTVEMKLDLAELSDDAVPSEWWFNFVRTVRQQGHAKRQWSFEAGDERGYGRLLLSDSEQMPVAVEMDWSQTHSELSVAVQGVAESPLTASWSAVPLDYPELFPEDKIVGDQIRKREDEKFKIPPASSEEQSLEQGTVNWQGTLEYVGMTLALASLSVQDAAGKVLATRSAFISTNKMLSVEVFDLPSSRKLGVALKLVSATLAGKDVVADVSIAKAGEATPVSQVKIDGFSSRTEETAFDVSGLAAGDYLVEATVTKGDRVLGKERKAWFISGAPEWLGNNIGILRSVPDPWTPIKQQGSSLEVWGRNHSFTGSLLPASLQVLDRQILTGPMRLIIKTADETIDTANVADPRIVVDEAGLRATITGQATGRTLTVKLDGELEFDGFGYFTFTLNPAREAEAVPVTSIIFEVPFKKKYAELYDDSNYQVFDTQSGLIPENGMELAGTDTVRVGDTYRGVQFYPMFAQLDPAQNAKPLVFTPTADAMLMRYHVSEGITINEALTSTIGIIGTPVRPRDAERIRKTGHCGGLGQAADHLRLNTMGLMDKADNCPENERIRKTADARDLTEAPDLREKGYSVALYGIGVWTNLKGVWGGTQPPGQIEPHYYNYSPGWCADFAKSRKEDWEKHRAYWLLKMQVPLITARSPEYAVFWKEWAGLNYDYLDQYKLDLAQYPGADARPPGDWTEVDWAVRSYQDFYIYSLDKLLRACAAEGVPVGHYFDCTWYKTKDPRPYRQFMQRIYQITRQHSPQSMIVSHMSGDRRMAIWSMVDVLFEGEQFVGKWRSHLSQNPGLHWYDCYPTLLSFDMIRAGYAGSLWGPQPVFLSQLDEPEPHGPGDNPIDLMRYGTGLMLAHDTIFWYWGEHFGKKADTGESPWLARARWGWDETVEFIPYWDSKGMLAVESSASTDIVASAWFTPDGNLTVIVFNNTDVSARVCIKVNERKFPVTLNPFSSAEDITSPVTGSTASGPDVYEYRKGLLEVDMRPRDYRLLIMK